MNDPGRGGRVTRVRCGTGSVVFGGGAPWSRRRRAAASPCSRTGAFAACLLAALSCTTIAGGGSKEDRDRPATPRPIIAADTDTVRRMTGDTAARDTTVRDTAALDVLGPENRVEAPARRRPQGPGPVVRVALNGHNGETRVGATGGWRLYDGNGRSVLVRGRGGESWRIEGRNGQLRAVRSDGTPTPWRGGPFIVTPEARGAFVTLGSRRYRGELVVTVVDTGLVVVNRLSLEDYLRGVVPLEIGDRPAGERAAVEAQAVAARSYAMTRLASPGRLYDLQSTIADQVYGGAEAERPVADAAVAATSGLVLLYGGRIVNAPYHSTCGGSTAALSESWWRRRDEPYLQRVSDRVPGTDRAYCDVAPRFRWTQSFTGPALQALVDRYLKQYAAVPAGGPGTVRALSVDGRTPSGRVSSVTITTDRGSYTVRGDDVRWVLRSSGSEILNSTDFSVEAMVVGRDGQLDQLTLRGNGYGHGIGMCQWGAIGRARAGQDFRTILRTYYPGTTVGRAG